jgi:SpoVK/Ycf46/Vps4 family AAA+-type ATPase
MLRAGGTAEGFSARFREELGKLLTAAPAPMRGAASAVATPVDLETKMPLLRVDDGGDVAEPILNEPERTAIETFVQQRLSMDELMLAGLNPPRSLLLLGPPGVGKTLTARHIARRLGLPLIDVELTAVVSSFLGKTGQNLRQLLDYARAEPSVLLLDEFDALAKRRDDQSDVGELKRLVNVLLLELERWPVESVLVAATNHPQLLDPAAARRFDFLVSVELPTFETRCAILQQALDGFGCSVDPAVVRACALPLEGETGAGLCSLAERAARAAVMGDADIGTTLVKAAISHLGRPEDLKSEARVAFCGLASHVLGMSNREIAKVIGATHPTVARLLKKWSDEQDNAEAGT